MTTFGERDRASRSPWLVDFVNRGAKRVRGQGGFVLATLGAAIGALGPIPIPGAWTLAILGAIVAFVGILLQVRLTPTYAELAASAIRDHERAEATAEALQATLAPLLRKLADHCDTNEAHQRMSVYCSAADVFVLLARHSRNARFEKPGRPTYPGDSGVIGEAWEIGESTKWNWPKDRTEWEAFQVREYGIPASVVARLNMHTRSVVAFRITHQDRNVGVLVMESTEARGVARKHLARARESLIMQSMAEIMLSSHPSFPAVAKVAKERADQQA